MVRRKVFAFPAIPEVGNATLGPVGPHAAEGGAQPSAPIIRPAR